MGTDLCDTAAAHPAAQREANFYGHPRGLLFIGCTELWERISFQGMLALLVLYMVDWLFRPTHVANIVGFQAYRSLVESVTGPLSSEALASQTFGLYLGTVFFTPVLGGLVGDRLLGRRTTVKVGAVLMTAGHFCMAFERLFLIALLLISLGSGAFTGNLASQLGDLYRTGDARRQAGFQIYYAVMTLGAFIAPIITGFLARAYGWPYAFGFAGVGMLAGLGIYHHGARYLAADPPRSTSVRRERLTSRDRRVVVVLLSMLPIATLFWIAQSQVWNTYNIWVRDHLNLTVGTWTVPVPWMQAFDALALLIMMPPILLLWRLQARRDCQPDPFSKIGIGCLIFGAALAWLACGQWVSSGKVPLWWALAFHLISNTGYIYFVPIFTTLFSTSAPTSVNAVMIGSLSLPAFAGSIMSGTLGRLYQQLPSTQFWLIHATIAGCAGLLFLLLARRLRRELAPPTPGSANE